MIVQFNNEHVVEAFRHDEYMDMKYHFINECGWSEQEYAEIEGYDWYEVEIKVTNQQGKSESVYLGACCSYDFEEDIRTGVGGYLPQMIEEAIDELNK